MLKSGHWTCRLYGPDPRAPRVGIRRSEKASSSRSSARTARARQRSCARCPAYSPQVAAASDSRARKTSSRPRRPAPDRRGICQVPEGRQVFGPMSVEDNLRLGAYPSGRERRSAQAGWHEFGVPDAQGKAAPNRPGRLPAASSRCSRSHEPHETAPLLLLDEPSLSGLVHFVGPQKSCASWDRAETRRA